MSRVNEDELISAALRRGLLSRADLLALDANAVTREVDAQSPVRGVRIDLLIQRGLLKEGDVAALERDVSSSSGSSDSEAAIEIEKPVEAWDRYEIGELLGAGGMGKVYRAFDPRLKRNVAIKFLLGENPSNAKRFLQEAQAQARIEHDFVCKTYEVGEVAGKPYIAMQYIAGETLNRIAEKMTLQEKVLIMQQVAEAVQAAHRLGIIHRDLKPSNIMVERTEDGRWRPYVMDFGLAKEISADGLTVSGVIMGTPWYMSPEQALGDTSRLDQRSDVYSLGATFYDLLAGSPPFQGSGLDVLVKLSQDDPPPLGSKDPTIPQEIETIIMKCLEKEPQRRYESARELAADLRRYLDGEPIHGRPVTWTYRIAKRARKHKTAVATVGVAVMLAVLSIGLWLHGRWTAAQRATLAQRLGQQVERIEGTLRQVYTLPLHDIRREKAMISSEMESSAEQIIQEMGTVGEAPGNYALGRIYFALQQYDKAAQHLQKSWQLDYREPEVAYALGRALGELYQRGMVNAAKLGSQEERDARRQELSRLYGQPAIDYLEASKDLRIESREYTQALIAYYKQDYDEALRMSDASSRKEPWLYEAGILKGKILRDVGNQRRDSGDTDGASAAYSSADQAFRAAIRIAESDPSAYGSLGDLCENRLYMEINGSGRDLDVTMSTGVAACEQGLQADPDDAGIRLSCARLHMLWGDYEGRAGRDPTDDLAEAISLTEQVLKTDPESADAHWNMSRAYWLRARYAGEHGVDPIAMLKAAASSGRRALAIRPNMASAYGTVGLAYLDMAVVELNKGGDPTAALNEAFSHFKRDAELEPKNVRPAVNMGITLWVRGAYEAAHGTDPTGTYQEAALRMRQAAAINPGQIYPPRFLVVVHRALALHQLNQGMDPSQALSDALQAHAMALKITADDYVSNVEAAGACAVKAQFEMQRGHSPQEDVDRARELIGRALAKDPTLIQAYQCAGEVGILEARWLISKDRNPEAAFAKALKSLVKGNQLNALDPATCETTADLYRWRAHWKSQRGVDPEPEIGQAIAWVDKTLAIDRSASNALAIRGAVYLLRARTRRDPGEKAAAARSAREAFGSALAINANLSKLYAADVEEAAAIEGGAGG